MSLSWRAPSSKGERNSLDCPITLSPWAPAPLCLTKPSVLKVSPTLHRDLVGRQPSSHPRCRCGGRSLFASLEALLLAARTPSSSLPTPRWMGGLLPGKRWGELAAAPQPAVDSSQGGCAVGLPCGCCGWPSFTQSYVSLSQLELRAVHCGLFLSCNTSQQRGHCTMACKEDCLNICYLNFP